MILSAMGSSSIPSVVICFRLRARYPSSPSVIEARTNSTDAAISCSPFDPFQGKCVDRIQSSTGIMTIRLIVMELGRFIRKAHYPETSSPAHLQLLHRQTARCVLPLPPHDAHNPKREELKVPPVKAIWRTCVAYATTNCALFPGLRHAQRIGGYQIFAFVAVDRIKFPVRYIMCLNNPQAIVINFSRLRSQMRQRHMLLKTRVPHGC